MRVLMNVSFPVEAFNARLPRWKCQQADHPGARGD